MSIVEKDENCTVLIVLFDYNTLKIFHLSSFVATVHV